MTDQNWANRCRESAKLLVRRSLHRAGLGLVRDPFQSQMARILTANGVTALLDVGANVGQYGSLVRSAGFGGTIVSVEPLSGAYARLAARSAGDSAWIAVNAAAGEEQGELTINVAANSYSSSALPMEQAHLDADARSAYIGSETVRVLTVQDLVRDHGLDAARTALKIDTQGYEYPALLGAGDLLDVIPVVQLELSFVQLYTGQKLFDELIALMAKHGLTLWNLEPGIADDAGRLLQVDGVFVRTFA